MVVMKSLPNWGVAAGRKRPTPIVADLPADPKPPSPSILSVEEELIRAERYGRDA
jgi:hypothetical protein